MWIRFFLFNLIFFLIIFFFTTEEDIKLPTEPFARFVDTTYFIVTMLSTIGFGDIAPISTKARFIVTCYMSVLFYIVVNQVSIYKPKIPSNF